MIPYFNSIYRENVIYSIDMVRLRLDFSGEERIVKFGNFLSDVTKIYIEQYPQSYKAYSYRNLFKIICSNNCSFVIGLSFNGNNKDSYYLGFLEFNPNKVADQREFREIFSRLRIDCFTAELVRWDLAVDVPIARDMCILRKDKRKYTLVQNSESDKTEYLGNHNNSGFVKLYNKRLEADLDYDVTRLEVTIAGDCKWNDFLKILPRVDVRGDQQTVNPYLELSGTDIVLYELLMKCDMSERYMYSKKLGRRKADRLKPFIFGSTYDSDKFVVLKAVYSQLRRQLREWTIGIEYTLSDEID